MSWDKHSGTAHLDLEEYSILRNRMDFRIIRLLLSRILSENLQASTDDGEKALDLWGTNIGGGASSVGSWMKTI
jgi:hypothetical protein